MTQLSETIFRRRWNSLVKYEHLHRHALLSFYYALRDALFDGTLRPGLVSFWNRRSAAEIGISLADVRLIAKSGLFDGVWYLEQNQDVAKARKDPLAHYLRVGAAQGRDPNPLFDSDWYLQQNPDVANAGINPLLHYLQSGAAEGRDPNPLFDSDWYLQQNPDVANAGINPLLHYLQSGAAEGRDPNPLFDGHWYLQQNPDVARTGDNPLVHYLRSGSAHDQK